MIKGRQSGLGPTFTNLQPFAIGLRVVLSNLWDNRMVRGLQSVYLHRNCCCLS